MPYKSKEDRNANSRKRYAKNSKKICSQQKEYRKNNPDFRARCYREELKRLYNLTPEQRLQLLIDQGCKCKICMIDITYESAKTDHIHGTKIVRGLLCDACNLGIGKLKDDFNAIKRAYLYVRDQGNI